MSDDFQYRLLWMVLAIFAILSAGFFVYLVVVSAINGVNIFIRLFFGLFAVMNAVAGALSLYLALEKD